MSQLERQSLPHRLAEEIAKSINSGEWRDVLPGYRTLCSYYKVSKSTCGTALKLLEERGVIEVAEVGKRRKISPCIIEPRAQKMNLLIIEDEGDIIHGKEADFFGKMVECWVDHGGEVQRIRADLHHWKQPGKLLRTWIADYSGTHLLFNNASAAWVEAVIEVGIPCYFLGGEILGSSLGKGDIPGSAHHLGHTIKMVLERVKKLGHRQLLIPLKYGMSARNELIKNSLGEVYGFDLLKSECEKILPIFTENTPSTWEQYWKRAFAEREVSLVIVFTVHHLLSLNAYCQSAGIDLRQDISVIVFENEDIMEWISPRPTSLEFPYPLALKDFKQWVESGCSQRKYNFLKMIWCEGETLRVLGSSGSGL